MENKNQRQTVQKTIVWETIQSMHTHPSAEEVYAEIHKKYEQVSRATVFRILNDLAKEKKILHLHMPYSADRYDYRLDKHWHIQCLECGKTADVPAGDVEDKDWAVENNIEGYKLTGFLVVYEGICPQCQQKEPS
jgi:Fe2+ or Zn2+ uptake regulation protein